MRKESESVNGVIFSPDKKEILLIKRCDIPVWVLPGGGIEKGETPEEAVQREVEEETGYHVTLSRKIAEYSPKCRLARFTHVYECNIERGNPTLGKETCGISFFPLNALPKKLPPPYPDWIGDASTFSKDLIEKKITSVNYLSLIKYTFSHPILVFLFFRSRLRS